MKSNLAYTLYLYIYIVKICQNRSFAYHRRNLKRIGEGIGILEGNGTAVAERLPIINEAVVVAKTLEELWANETRRTKPATRDVNATDLAPTDTKVHDLDGVARYATWEW